VEKKQNARLRKQAKQWADAARDVCGTYFQFAFSHPGFLEHTSTLNEASLASCADLGTAINKAGGLVGGEIGK